MSEYKNILKEMYETDGIEFKDNPDLDDTIEEIDDEYTPEVTDTSCEIYLGSKVKVVDAEGMDAENYDIDEDDLEELKLKVEDGAYAIVFDELEDDEEKVSIVFEDGLEVFRIEKTRLACFDDEDDEEIVKRTDEPIEIPEVPFDAEDEFADDF